jgi:hypothetical protein
LQAAEATNRLRHFTAALEQPTPLYKFTAPNEKSARTDFSLTLFCGFLLRRGACAHLSKKQLAISRRQIKILGRFARRK